MSHLSNPEEPEIECTLSKEKQVERRQALRDGIVQRIRRVRELGDGYAFGLALTDEDEASTRDFVAFEAQCCGFASYDITSEPAESAIWLSVRGPAGTKEFARQLVPGSVAIEAMQEGAPGSNPNLLKAGVAGLTAAIIGIVCCVTPLLSIGLGAFGLSAAVATASFWLDAIALPLLAVSVLAIGVGTWRRRTVREV